MIGICKKQYHLYPPKIKNAKIKMLKYKCNKILVDLWGKTRETFLRAMKEKTKQLRYTVHDENSITKMSIFLKLT